MLDEQRKLTFWENVCVYPTVSFVRIVDWRLGCLKYSFVGVICLYILLYSFLYKGNYTRSEAPVGAVRFSLQHHTPSGCDPLDTGCELTLREHANIPYCDGNKEKRPFKKFQCINIDLIEASTSFENSVLVATRITEILQKRVCPREPKANTTTKCKAIWKEMKPESKFFVADIEHATMMIDHSVTAPTIGISGTARGSPQGYLHVPQNDELCKTTPSEHQDSFESAITGPLGDMVRGAPCMILPNSTASSESDKEKGFDVFTIGTLLAAAGGNLDDMGYRGDHSNRYLGMVLFLEIRYFNFYPWSGILPHGAIEYQYSAHILKGTGAKVMWQQYVEQNMLERVVQKRHGVLVVVEQVGDLHAVDFSVILVTLTTSLALLAVAGAVVDFLAIYIAPRRQVYRKYKYKDTPVFTHLGGVGSGRSDGDSSAEDAPQETAPFLKHRDPRKKNWSGILVASKP